MTTTVVLDVHGLTWASSATVIESTLLRRPGGVRGAGQCRQSNRHCGVRPFDHLSRRVVRVGA